MKTRVTFGKPGAFLIDGVTELHIDGLLGYRGSFRDGFEVWADLAPGPHPMRATIELGPISRARFWQLDVPPDDGGVLAVQIRYSRLWGNFKPKLVVTRGPA